jgi:hypothetical protein
MWEKQTPVDGSKLLSMDEVIAVGFGDASLLKDGKVVWREEYETEFDDCMTVQQAEDMAVKEPNHDWRIHIVGPLSEFYYQRQGVRTWVLYRRGEGFA